MGGVGTKAHTHQLSGEWVSSVTQGRRQSILNKLFPSWLMNLAAVSVFNPLLRTISMAAEEEALPQLLILKPPSLFSDFQYKFSPKFQLLKAWESPLPTTLFLTTHAHSVKAVVSSSSSPITSDILRHLPSLQLVVATTVGLNQIDLPECRRRGISITNAGKSSQKIAPTWVWDFSSTFSRKSQPVIGSSAPAYGQSRRTFLWAPRSSLSSVFHVYRIKSELNEHILPYCVWNQNTNKPYWKAWKSVWKFFQNVF